MLKKVLVEACTWAGLCGMLVMMGGFSIWLTRDVPAIAKNAGTIALIGLAIFLGAGFLMLPFAPPPRKSTEDPGPQ